MRDVAEGEGEQGEQWGEQVGEEGRGGLARSRALAAHRHRGTCTWPERGWGVEWPASTSSGTSAKSSAWLVLSGWKGPRQRLLSVQTGGTQACQCWMRRKAGRRTVAGAHRSAEWVQRWWAGRLQQRTASS